MRKIFAVLVVSVLVSACFLTLISPVKAASKTIIVPDNYPTITSAIDHANSGDTILVKEGTYSETQLIINKALTIISETGKNPQINLNPPIINTYYYYLPIQAPDSGIKIQANNVKISGFKISNTGDISANGDGNEFSNNQVLSSQGITMYGSHLILNQNSIATSLSITGSGQTVTDNTITSGIVIEGSFGTFKGNSLGSIFYTGGSNGLFSENTISGGFTLDNCNQNIINNNVCGVLDIGFPQTVPSECSNNIISGNIIQGIAMGSGRNNTIYHNYVNGFKTGHGGSGVASNYNPVVADNIFYDNVMMDNSYSTYLMNAQQSNNYWNNGQIGNYWSNYNGKDSNGDGIGDTPYVLNSNNVDNHPLIHAPFGVSDVKVSLSASLSNNTWLANITWVVAIILVAAILAVLAALVYRKKAKTNKTQNTSSVSVLSQ
jgi:nitrous oxidase accessory protein